MTTEKKDPEVQPGNQQEPTNTPTQRERYRTRRKEAYPDVNEDDEEAYYGQANKDLDELESYRENNKALADVFDKAPTLAGMLLAAKEGENPFVYLAEQAGPDLDIRELINDPDFGEKMSQALTKYQEGQVKGKQAQAEMQQNFQQSFDALKQIQQERGMSDEDCIALVEKMFGSEEDDGIIGKAARGIVSKETWEAVLKAQNYDADMEEARQKAGAQAMNQRIQNPLKSFDDTEMPPTLSTGGATDGEGNAQKPLKFFDDWEKREGI